MSRPVRGVVSRRALLADGWNATSLQRELRSGRLVALRRGAYAPATLLLAAAREPNLAYAVDVAAVAATQGRGVVASHLTAAVLISYAGFWTSAVAGQEATAQQGSSTWPMAAPSHH